jgi:DNA-binding SARP family transcriptional activator
MRTLKINLFGQLLVECGGKVWHGPEGCKVRELFCYLMIHRITSHNRERLASLLWGESCTAQSKKYLRQALWQLRSACVEHLGQAEGRLLLVNPEWIQVNPEVEVWVDVAVFEEYFACLRSDEPLNDESAQVLDDAVHLYKDDLLVGWYQDWCLYERERYQNMYLLMLDKLVGYCEANRNYTAGVEYSARILHYDPAHERAHQQMMRMYHLAGDRTAALRQFDRCVESLKKELNVAPAQSTLALWEQICADHVEQPLPASPLAVAEPSSLLPAFLLNLRQMQHKLAEIQCELQQEIQAIEKALPQLKISAKNSRER